MGKRIHSGKRLLALTLALVMALGTVTECLAAVVRQPVAQGDGETVTWGELIADSYDRLTDAEKAILRSGLLKDTVTYTAPGNGDGLIAVDGDARRLSVQTTVEKDGLLWTVQSARISYTGGEETVALDENGAGSFTYTGNDYTALADYAAALTMEADRQVQLMKLPRRLVAGWNGMKEIAAQDYVADLLGENIEQLVTLVNGGIQTPYGVIGVDDSNKAPIEELYRQTQVNASGKLDVADKIQEYGGASGKVRYLTESGADFRKVAEDYCETTGFLVDEAVNGNCLLNAVKTMLSFFGGSMTAEQKTKLTAAKTALELLQRSRTAIMAALADEWTILTERAFKDDMTAADYAAMDTLAAAAAAENGLTAEEVIDGLFGVTEDVRVLTVTVAAQVNRCDVTVGVQALVIPLESRDSAAAETKKYAAAATLTLAAGMSRAEVEAAIERALTGADSVEALALAGWTAFGVDGVNYTRELRAEKDYTALTENAAYTVVYTPKRYALDLGDGNGAKQVPYGYNAVLPAYVNQPGENRSYQYEKDGVLYGQDGVYRVVGDTVFLRMKDKPRTKLTYGALAAGMFESMSDEVRALLESEALRLNERFAEIRIPDETDGVVDFAKDANGVYTVTARPYASRYKTADGQELLWTPVRAISDKDEEIRLTAGDGGAYTGTAAAAIDSVEVRYRLELKDAAPGLEESAALAAALPEKLAADAADHRNALAVLSGQKSRLQQVTGAQIKALKNEESLPEFVRSALSAVADNCFEDNELKLYRYILEYESLDKVEKLAWFYAGDRYRTIKAQAQLLYEQLDAALGGSDPEKQAEAQAAIKSVLVSFGAGAEDYEKIERVRTSLAEVIGALPDGIDPQIDTGKDMTAFVACLDAAGKAAAPSGAPTYAAEVAVTAEGPESSVAVRTAAGRRIYNGTVLDDALSIAAAEDGAVVTLHEAAALNGDVTVDKRLRITGAERLTAQGGRFLLDGGGRLTADHELTAFVAPRDAENYRLRTVADEDGTITYAVDEVQREEPVSSGTVLPADAAVTAVDGQGTVRTVKATGGRYSLDGFAAGYYDLCFEKTGYVPYRVERFYFSGEGDLPSVKLVKTGNVNGSAAGTGDVDVTDLECLFEWLSLGRYTGGIEEKGYMLAVADVNGDGRVDILDYQRLYMVLQE